MIAQLQFAANVIAGFLSAYTDIKTGYIYDWITYPLIGIGILFTIFTQQWLGLVLGVLIYGVGWLAYRSGKMGGGDIKLLAGIALVQPLYQGMIFPLAVLLIAALSACIVFCLYYVGKVLMKKTKIKWDTPRKRMAGGMTVLFFIFIYILATSPAPLGILFWATVLALGMGIIFYALEEEIKATAFLQRITLEQMEDDEVVATEHLTKEEKEKWGGKPPAMISREDIPALKHRGFTHVPVYRNLPKFAPFLLVGIIVVYMLPDLVLPLVPTLL